VLFRYSLVTLRVTYLLNDKLSINDTGQSQVNVYSDFFVVRVRTDNQIEIVISNS